MTAVISTALRVHVHRHEVGWKLSIASDAGLYEGTQPIRLHVADEASIQVVRDLVERVDQAGSDGWRPIATAPKGELIDLWVVPPSKPHPRHAFDYSKARSMRLADCQSSGNLGAWTQRGAYVTGLRFINEKGERCLDPNDTSEYASRATHWRPHPAPPAPLKSENADG